MSQVNLHPKVTIQWTVRRNKIGLALSRTFPSPRKGASVVGVVVVFIAFSAILVSGCVDLTPPWKRAHATGAGGTVGASDSGGGVTAFDGGSDGTGGMIAIDGTGEAGGDWASDVAGASSGDGSGDGMADEPIGAEETGSDPVGDATVDGNDDVAVSGAGGAGGYGEVGMGAGGSGADGTETDASGSETGGGGTTGTGGRWGTGGNSSSGGSMGSGGIAATGGTWATGGKPTTGGSTGTGGLIASGGAPATGGNSSTGGVPGTGGSSSVACSGVLYSGICWYLAPSGDSCTQACTDHGGPSSLAVGHVGTAAQGGSLTECATILSLLGVAGTVQNVASISGVGCSSNTGTMAAPGPYWCTSPDFSTTASLAGVQPACGCLR